MRPLTGEEIALIESAQGLGGLCLVPAIVIATFRLRNPCIKAERHKVPVSHNTSLPLNKGLYLGTHNSCHVSPLFSGCFPAHCGPAQWRYSHPPIVEQLEDGIRHVEIDIWFNMDTRHWEIFHHFPGSNFLDWVLPAEPLSQIHW